MDTFEEAYDPGVAEAVTEAEWVDREAARMHAAEYGSDAVPWADLPEEVKQRWRREVREAVAALSGADAERLAIAERNYRARLRQRTAPFRDDAEVLLAEYDRRGAALARRSAVVEAATEYAAHRKDAAAYLAGSPWQARESVLVNVLVAAVEAEGGDQR